MRKYRALAVVLAGLFSHARRAQRVERAADCAGLAFAMTFANHFGLTWLAYAGAALGFLSVVAMFYFYFRKSPAT